MYNSEAKRQGHLLKYYKFVNFIEMAFNEGLYISRVNVLQVEMNCEGGYSSRLAYWYARRGEMS